MITAQALKKINKLEKELAAVKAEVLSEIDVPYDDELTDECKFKLTQIMKESPVGVYEGPGSLVTLAAKYAD